MLKLACQLLFEVCIEDKCVYNQTETRWNSNGALSPGLRRMRSGWKMIDAGTCLLGASLSGCRGRGLAGQLGAWFTQKNLTYFGKSGWVALLFPAEEMSLVFAQSFNQVIEHQSNSLVPSQIIVGDNPQVLHGFKIRQDLNQFITPAGLHMGQ